MRRLLLDLVVIVCVALTLAVAALLAPRVFGYPGGVSETGAEYSEDYSLMGEPGAMSPGTGATITARIRQMVAKDLVNDQPLVGPETAGSPAYHWRTATATFYAWRQWGYGVPADQKIPGGRSGHFACGGRYLRNTVAVAHRTLPCGTIVRFCWRGKCINAPVRDRFRGNGFDLTSEACLQLGHCWTGPVKWRVVRP